MSVTPIQTPEQLLRATDSATLLRSFARLTHLLTAVGDIEGAGFCEQRDLIQTEILRRMQ